MTAFIEVKGTDNDRCVFKTTDPSPNFYKFYFGNDAYQAFQREYFLTTLLAKGVENVVQQTGGELTTQDDMSKKLVNTGKDCVDKINASKPNIPHFITRNIGSKTKTLSDWLENYPGNDPIPTDIIRTFAFQLIYLVSKMHSQFGVQHNDIYELNIMVRELGAGEKKDVTVVIGQDLFQLELVEKHLEVFLFDFGASQMKRPKGFENNDNEWEKKSDISFEMNNPPEILYTKKWENKGPEADMFMIGHVLLNMFAHNNNGFKYREYIGVHTYDVTPQQISAMGLTGKGFDTVIPGKPLVLEKIGLVTTDGVENNKAYQLIWLNLIALDVMFNGYEKGQKPPVDVAVTKSSGVDDFYKDIEKKTTRKDYVTTKYQWLKKVFETQHPNAFSLVKRLMAFSPRERRGFAFPGPSYCLTTALFHPYFQSFYKGEQTTVPDNLLFNPPLVYNTSGTEPNSKELGEQTDIFYGELMVKYLRDYPNEQVSIAVLNYVTNQDKTAFENAVTIAQIDHLLKKIYPGKAFPKKEDRISAVLRLIGLQQKLPATQQAIVADQAAKLQAAKLAQEKAEEEARQKLADAQAAEELAKQAAATKAKEEVEALAAEQEKKAQEAKVLKEAQELAEETERLRLEQEKAKADADAVAAEQAKVLAEAQKLAEEIERLRIEKEKEAKEKAEAEEAKKQLDAAQAAAAKAKQEAEDARKVQEAAKAAEEEEARKLAEVQKAKTTIVTVNPQPVIEVGGEIFTKEEQNVLWVMRQITKATDKEYLEKFEKTNGQLENIFTDAYIVLKAYATKNKFGRIADISEAGKTRTNLFNRGRYTLGNIIPYAVDVIATFYLIFKQTTTEKDFEDFFKKGGTSFNSIKVGELGNWSETYLGPFLDQFARSNDKVAPTPSTPVVSPPDDSTSEGTDSVPEKEPTPPKKSTPAVDEPKSKPVVLTPAPKQVVPDRAELRQNMISATTGLIDLMLELFDTSKANPVFKATPSTTAMTEHAKGIARHLYTMADTLKTLLPNMNIAKTIIVNVNGENKIKQLLKWQKASPEFIFDPALKDLPDDEKELLAYPYTATKSNYTNLIDSKFFDNILSHIYFIGVKAILESKSEGSFAEFAKSTSGKLFLPSLPENTPKTVLDLMNKLKEEIKK